jgi:hypothetical protein
VVDRNGRRCPSRPELMRAVFHYILDVQTSGGNTIEMHTICGGAKPHTTCSKTKKEMKRAKAK